MRNWPTLPPLPNSTVPIMRADGGMDVNWYRYFLAADPIIRALTELTLNDLADVDADSPADGEQLSYIDADGTWQPDTA